ncbi:2-oxoacid dehydrogenase/acyltransferase catalytic subunit [Sphingobium sp. AEW010]|nr:pyruvate/2-oxoglutarate dehydrogenase complex dihydrolipoamide acyltransferase (E2) component [Sphingobium sp. JAI105]TWD05695.1 2-oxoacid dehydrogenase/acyltransferase catalytic subunit [Sphingobium sp. AEW010]TWD23248.1 2-oxoacid dehydrogenase/acyltransferase catalytic subunit [Sphingobium sp. AEW013]TWD25108.1 2-oxoacid dehydrogenase/acyltransferase catalytic subunit [Sphingobium sp. AEW001]
MTELLANLAPWPNMDFAEFGEVERRPISRIQKFVASFLGRNWVAIPHVTHNDDADVTALESRRKALAAQGGAS